MDYQRSNVWDFLNANGHVVLESVDRNYNLRHFTQKEIEYITNGYSTVVGEGGFGTVYKGNLDGLHLVAVKIYKNGTKKEKFAKELIVHSQINHKNVVRLLGCCTEVNALMIVMEFVCNGNLYDILHCSNANGSVSFPLDKRLDITIESAEVFSCMHSMYSPILHGDIKPANILLDENLRPKISDFGIARLLAADETEHTRNFIGCRGYMDPLFCQSGILTLKSDVYSFGVVLLEIITRKKAVEGNIVLALSFADALRKGRMREMFDEEISNDKRNMKFIEDIAKLAAECLKMEVKMRPKMVEVADRLRTIRKAYHKHKGRNSTGSNPGLTKSVKAEDVLSHTPITTATVNNTVPTISMYELRKITRSFRPDALIGEDIYGEVFSGVLTDGHKSTIKKLWPGVTLEVPVVSSFRHENVLQLLGYCVEEDNRFLAYEYISRGSLHDILRGQNNPRMHVLSWAQRVKIALGAATGLEFLHEKAQPCVIHREIKCSNIFLFDNDVAKIGCPGVFVEVPDYTDRIDLHLPLPRSHYEAPECVMDDEERSIESDVYSFGVVLLELLAGRNADPKLAKPSDGPSLMEWVRRFSSEADSYEDNKRKKAIQTISKVVDQRLQGNYLPKAVVKMALLAGRCVQNYKKSRPQMSMVVEILRNISSFTEASRREASSSVVMKQHVNACEPKRRLQRLL